MSGYVFPQTRVPANAYAVRGNVRDYALNWFFVQSLGTYGVYAADAQFYINGGPLALDGILEVIRFGEYVIQRVTYVNVQTFQRSNAAVVNGGGWTNWELMNTGTGVTPVGSSPVGSSTPVGVTPVGSTPVGVTPVGTTTPVGNTPVGVTPVGVTPVISVAPSTYNNGSLVVGTNVYQAIANVSNGPVSGLNRSSGTLPSGISLIYVGNQLVLTGTANQPGSFQSSWVVSGPYGSVGFNLNLVATGGTVPVGGGDPGGGK